MLVLRIMSIRVPVDLKVFLVFLEKTEGVDNRARAGKHTRNAD